MRILGRREQCGGGQGILDFSFTILDIKKCVTKIELF
jgi:hypothetical protein